MEKKLLKQKGSEVIVEMELTRENFRAMIYYDFRYGLSNHECYDRLISAFGDEAPSFSTVFRWYKEFQANRKYLKDEPREGRPATAVTEENIEKSRKLLTEDRRITYASIAATLDIGMKAVHQILHDHLRVRKLCCRWIPHRLTSEQKKMRVNWCKDMIEKFRRGESTAVYNIATGDESWIYCYEPETKQQSAQWIFEDEEKPTKVKQSKSAGKQMIVTFFGKTGHIFTLAVEDRKTVNAEWYTNTCLPKVINELRKTNSQRRIILHHDNAPPHAAQRTKEFLKAVNVEQMTHPPYSPDLAPCDFFLFPFMKDKMRGLRFDNAESAVNAYQQLLSEVPEEKWRSCFNDWFRRMEKCIKYHGDYFEKQ